MAINEQYYNYWQQRQSALKRAYTYHMNICIRIQNVANCIKAGGDPSKDAKDDYFYLIGELGEDILREELGRVVVEMKEKPQ